MTQRQIDFSNHISDPMIYIIPIYISDHGSPHVSLSIHNVKTSVIFLVLYDWHNAMPCRVFSRGLRNGYHIYLFWYCVLMTNKTVIFWWKSATFALFIKSIFLPTIYWFLENRANTFWSNGQRIRSCDMKSGLISQVGMLIKLYIKQHGASLLSLLWVPRTSFFWNVISNLSAMMVARPAIV